MKTSDSTTYRDPKIHRLCLPFLEHSPKMMDRATSAGQANLCVPFRHSVPVRHRCGNGIYGPRPHRYRRITGFPFPPSIDPSGTGNGKTLPASLTYPDRHPINYRDHSQDWLVVLMMAPVVLMSTYYSIHQEERCIRQAGQPSQ